MTTPETVQIQLNGTVRAVNGQNPTVADLLRDLELEATAVAVAVNRAVIRRRDLETTQLGDGDQVEIIHAVAGG